MSNLKTTIGLEIHVQLKTKSKMFCRCDNNAEGKAPNTVVCPVCLGLPGALPVANEQAILWTIKTGLAINSKIGEIAKFDRKHYFYPDLPKGYQISQYDEPFCIGGEIEIDGQTIRFNRIHLEEDAGKLIHSGSKSLVDLNRAGTPLMEMVTEPDITSPKQAGDFLRRLQKLVRDEVKVSAADMEKGHLRCDANISVTDGTNMSEIVEIKNLNSFRFVEKALTLEEERLKSEYPNWKKGKVTRGYDSDKNITYIQGEKEEAADYRYFPEPDLPPIDTTKFDLESMKAEIGDSLESKTAALIELGLPAAMAKTILSDRLKSDVFYGVIEQSDKSEEMSRSIANMIANKFFAYSKADIAKAPEIIAIAGYLADGTISKNQAIELLKRLGEPDFSVDDIREFVESLEVEKGSAENELELIIDEIIADSPNEVAAYKAGKVQLIGFFIGQAIKAAGGKADAKKAGEILKKKLS